MLGIEPDKEFDCMLRYCSEVSEPMLEGMMPLMRLTLTSSFVKLPKLPIERGNDPVSVKDDNAILTTRA